MRDEWLRGVELRRDKVASFTEYPFNLPAVRGLESIEFTRPVTYFVGENGSGKSTLIEAIAIKWGFNPEGGSTAFRFSTASSHSVSTTSCGSTARRTAPRTASSCARRAFSISPRRSTSWA